MSEDCFRRSRRPSNAKINPVLIGLRKTEFAPESLSSSAKALSSLDVRAMSFALGERVLSIRISRAPSKPGATSAMMALSSGVTVSATSYGRTSLAFFGILSVAKCFRNIRYRVVFEVTKMISVYVIFALFCVCVFV